MPPQRWRRQAEIIANLLGEVVRRQVPLFGRVGGENTRSKAPGSEVGHAHGVPWRELKHVLMEQFLDSVLKLRRDGMLKSSLCAAPCELHANIEWSSGGRVGFT